jgi:hypothetical protein
MQLNLDDRLLEKFIRQFYGYGNYQGNFWFVGMEERGGNSLEDVAKRLHVWSYRGQRELEDVAEYHVQLGIDSFFPKRPRIQRTWGKLIRILLAVKHLPFTTKQVCRYQRDYLGRSTGDTCLLELLPLPSPSTKNWLYADYSQLPYLKDRTTYKQTLLDERIAHLRQRIEQYRPAVVLFYGISYRKHWRAIVNNVDFSPSDDTDYYSGNNGSQLFLIIKHPVARGLSNDYFHKIGAAISKHVVCEEN